MAIGDKLTPGDFVDKAGKRTYVRGKKKKRHKFKRSANAKAPLGQGGRFAALQQKLGKQGVRDPAALAASIGRAKYGKKKFASLGR